MLAPGRLLELIRDRRDTAAAVANATTALTKGPSATNHKFVFILFISSVRRPRFQNSDFSRANCTTIRSKRFETGLSAEIPHRAVSTRIEYGVEIRGCNLGAALGAIKLGKGEHLLRSGGTAGDSFVGFDGIFERYRVYSRHL
jgi:hypothetical protein